MPKPLLTFLADVFTRFQVTINEQEISSPKKPEDQISRNGSNDSNEMNKYNKALKTQVEQLIKQRMDTGPCPSPAQSRAALNTPRKDFPKLTFGEAEDATKGLNAFIGLSDEDHGKLLPQGIRAIQDEFIQHGSLQDLENFYYVCYGIAEHDPDMPAHVKDDIKKVRWNNVETPMCEYKA